MERCRYCGGSEVVRSQASWRRALLALVVSPRRHCLHCDARWRERHRLLPHDSVATPLSYWLAFILIDLLLVAAVVSLPRHPIDRLKAAVRHRYDAKYGDKSRKMLKAHWGWLYPDMGEARKDYRTHPKTREDAR